MGLVTAVQVRQPARDDLVASSFAVAGFGAGFEGTVVVTVRTVSGRRLAQTSAQIAADGFAIGEFVAKVEVANPPRPGTRVVVEVTGDNPGEGRFPRREVEVIMFADSRGWLVHRVEAGDTLTGILRGLRDLTRATVAQVVAANPRVEDPDVIEVGWRLRIPVR